jgi:hypothetical protein
MTTGSPPSITAMAEFVVPRSIPIALGMGGLLLLGFDHRRTGFGLSLPG